MKPPEGGPPPPPPPPPPEQDEGCCAKCNVLWIPETLVHEVLHYMDIILLSSPNINFTVDSSPVLQIVS